MTIPQFPNLCVCALTPGLNLSAQGGGCALVDQAKQAPLVCTATAPRDEKKADKAVNIGYPCHSLTHSLRHLFPYNLFVTRC